MKKWNIRNSKLGRKFIIPVMITILVVSLFSSFFRAVRDHQLLEGELTKKGNILVKVAAETFRQPLWNFDENSIRAGVEALMSDNEVESVVLKDEWGQVLQVEDKHRDFTDSGYVVYEKDIIHGDHIIGHLSITLTNHWVMLLQRQNILISALWLLILIISPLVVLLHHTKNILHPLKVLGEAMNHISSGGDLSYRIGSLSDDELGELAVHFNEMTISLQSNLERISYMAYHDKLTGFYNHAMLKLEDSIWQENPNQKAALYFIDIDNFKQINDNMGHSVGDKFLSKLAERLYTLKLINVRIFHLGADEFVFLLLYSEDISSVSDFALRILEMCRWRFQEDSFVFDSAASIGISISPEDGRSIEELVMKADIAVNKAKEAGKDHFIFFNEKMLIELTERQKIIAYLKEAISNQELSIVYQPVVSLIDGKVHRMEALLRWYNADLGWVSPLKFIPIAENSGMIVPIGNWVFSEVSKLLDEHEELCRDEFRIAVNVSGIQLQHNSLIEAATIFVRHADHIEIEVTETVLLHSYSNSIRILKQLRDMGYTISLDDFGTGYSSLSYLQELPLDVLKIDKKFIDDVCSSSKQKGIVSVILNIAKELSLDVVAEGVETEEQQDLLREIGCDNIQGYLYFKPAPFNELVQKVDFSTGKILL